MAFPADPFGALVELLIDGAWTDITADVRISGGVAITRGRADEGSRTDPGKCAMVLNNRDGKYSPRNPSSPYYGLIGRNTPIRVSVLGGESYLVTPGTAATDPGAGTPDAGSLDITGDIDVRVDVGIRNWVTSGTGNSVELAGKFHAFADQRSWILMARNGLAWFEWSTDGTGATVQQRNSTVPIPLTPHGRLALRVNLDVNNGAGGHTVTFLTAPTIAGPWTVLGEPIVTAGTTSIFNSTAELLVGDSSTGLVFLTPDGNVYAFELRDGIDGTLVAAPDFTTQAPGSTGFTDSVGRDWTVWFDSSISNRYTRFVGEVSAWPPRWDVAEKDVWVPIEAAGILRRLGQGAAPLSSALFRGVTTQAAGLVAYWPLEDLDGSTQLASAVGGQAMRITGAPELSAYTEFDASQPLPVLKGAEFSGVVPTYSSTGAIQVRFFLAIPDTGAANGQTLCRIRTSGTARMWHLNYTTGGYLTLQAFGDSGTVLDTGEIAFAVNGQRLLISIELSQDGNNIDWAMASLVPGTGTGAVWSGTLNGQTVGQAGGVIMSPDGGLDDVTMGHVYVQSQITTLFDLRDQLAAWVNETAGRRIERLCMEEGIPFSYVGALDSTAVMGAQLPSTLLDLLGSAAEADGGILHETRDGLGLAYRPRSSRYNELPAMTLDYAGGDISPPLDPTEDDQQTRNDITVTRAGGSSARVVREDGPLSVQPPPAGVGRYDESVTLALAGDSQLADQASWRVHLGTWDEARYPQVTVDLAANPALTAEVTTIESGDRVTLVNPPAWIPPGDIDLAALGYSEVVGPFEWRLTFNCAPFGPWRVATYDVARYGTAGTVLAEALDATETGVDITTVLGPRWTTDASEMPFDVLVGGEVMTVTAVSGTTASQTFTVVRSVNGVAKSHAAGGSVGLLSPAIRAL